MGLKSNLLVYLRQLTVSFKENLEDFWNLESIGVTDDPVHSDEDQRAIKKFKESVKFDGCRYQVQWPWKHDITDLPVNR